MHVSASENGPDHRELYLLIAGVVAGILLGPAVLGRLAPAAHDSLFPSVDQAQRQLAQLETSLASSRLQLRQTGATDAAIAELEERLLPRRNAPQAELELALRSRGRSTALLVAIAVTMILEAVIGSRRRVSRRRLARARYALIAVWSALMLAQPETLTHVSMSFLTLLTLIVLIAAWAPGGKGADAT